MKNHAFETSTTWIIRLKSFYLKPTVQNPWKIESALADSLINTDQRDPIQISSHVNAYMTKLTITKTGCIDSRHETVYYYSVSTFPNLIPMLHTFSSKED